VSHRYTLLQLCGKQSEDVSGLKPQAAGIPDLVLRKNEFCKIMMDKGLFSYRHPVKGFIAVEPYRTAGGSGRLTVGQVTPSRNFVAAPS